VDAEGSPTLLNCLMYKLSYYKFGELKVRPEGSPTLLIAHLMRDSLRDGYATAQNT
jgi:hypothetical protein